MPVPVAAGPDLRHLMFTQVNVQKHLKFLLLSLLASCHRNRFSIYTSAWTSTVDDYGHQTDLILILHHSFRGGLIVECLDRADGTVLLIRRFAIIQYLLWICDIPLRDHRQSDGVTPSQMGGRVGSVLQSVHIAHGVQRDPRWRRRCRFICGSRWRRVISNVDQVPPGRTLSEWLSQKNELIPMYEYGLETTPKSECVSYRQIRALLFVAWYHRIVRRRTESERSIVFVIPRTFLIRIGLGLGASCSNPNRYSLSEWLYVQDMWLHIIFYWPRPNWYCTVE